MIKKKLAIQIAQRIGNGREETTKLLDVLCEVLGDTLDAGVFVHLTGLGRLTVREYPAQKGFDPRTRGFITMAAKKSPVFKANKSLKGKSNEAGA